MADVIVPLTGWGSQGWGEAAWGYGNVSFQATASVGTVTVAANADVTLTGVSATGDVGSVTVTATANVTLTGTPAGGTFSGTSVTGNSFDPPQRAPSQSSEEDSYDVQLLCSGGREDWSNGDVHPR